MRQWVENETLFKIEQEYNRLRMGGGSWTINLDLIPHGIKKVVYITDQARYSIDMAWAKEKGFERMFQDENKLVVPIKNWRVKKGEENVLKKEG